MPHTYFVNDHRQGFRDEHVEGFLDEHVGGLRDERVEGFRDEHVGGLREGAAPFVDCEEKWLREQDRRWSLRKELFPMLSDDIFIFANFNQLYKIDPKIFRVWLRILQKVPQSILWLLRFPAAGEQHLRRTAAEWAGREVAARIVFTDVAPKHLHIHRGRVADLFLDTSECNAHTTAADILWSGTPLITYSRHLHKMCSRVAASLAYATEYGSQMVVHSDLEYEQKAVEYALAVRYEYTLDERQDTGACLHRIGYGPLMELRKALFLGRDTSPLFDTRRWVRNVEKAYLECWRRFSSGEQFDKAANNDGCIWIEDDKENAE